MDSVKFEARVFVDGHMIAFAVTVKSNTAVSGTHILLGLLRSIEVTNNQVPSLLLTVLVGLLQCSNVRNDGLTCESSPEFSKNGNLEPLKFPAFRQEILQQSYWSPADDLGRIKVVISEGFPRDSVSAPTERVKNIVAFSFQHAPLGMLLPTCPALKSLA